MEDSNLEFIRAKIVVRATVLPPYKARLEPFLANLNTKDQDRAARFRFDDDRARLVAGRLLLAECLIRFLDLPLETILDLSYSEHARPRLPRHPEIQFSISHSGNLVVVALSLRTLVGIDIERKSPAVDLDALSRRIMSPDEVAQFQGVPLDEKESVFFQAWTAKEAWLKAQGVGISAGMTGASPPIRADLEPQPLTTSPKEDDGQPWQVQALPVPEGYAGNVVWNDPAKSVDFGWIDLAKE